MTTYTSDKYMNEHIDILNKASRGTWSAEGSQEYDENLVVNMLKALTQSHQNMLSNQPAKTERTYQ